MFKQSWVVALALVVPTITSLPSVSHAGSCSSGASVAADIWKQCDEIAAAGGCAVLAAASPEAAAACLAAYGEAKMIEQLIGFWNEQVGNTWAAVGPRMLPFDDPQSGKLVGTSGRLYVMPSPSLKDRLTLKLTKTDGKARTAVTVCKHAPNGTSSTVWEFEFDNGKDNIGTSKSKTFSDAKGYIYTVHLDAKSVTNTFSYKLQASQ